MNIVKNVWVGPIAPNPKEYQYFANTLEDPEGRKVYRYQYNYRGTVSWHYHHSGMYVENDTAKSYKREIIKKGRPAKMMISFSKPDPKIYEYWMYPGDYSNKNDDYVDYKGDSINESMEKIDYSTGDLGTQFNFPIFRIKENKTAPKKIFNINPKNVILTYNESQIVKINFNNLDIDDPSREYVTLECFEYALYSRIDFPKGYANRMPLKSEFTISVKSNITIPDAGIEGKIFIDHSDPNESTKFITVKLVPYKN